MIVIIIMSLRITFELSVFNCNLMHVKCLA